MCNPPLVYRILPLVFFRSHERKRCGCQLLRVVLDTHVFLVIPVPALITAMAIGFLVVFVAPIATVIVPERLVLWTTISLRFYVMIVALVAAIVMEKWLILRTTMAIGFLVVFIARIASSVMPKWFVFRTTIAMRFYMVAITMMTAPIVEVRLVLGADTLAMVRDLAVLAVRLVGAPLELGFDGCRSSQHHRQDEEEGLNEGSDLHGRGYKKRAYAGLQARVLKKE